MWKVSIALLSLLMVVARPLHAQPSPLPDTALLSTKTEVPKQDKVDLSSPEQTLRSMAAAFNRFDASQMAQCVVGATRQTALQLPDFLHDLKRTRAQIEISPPRVRFQNDYASATYYLQFKAAVDKAAPRMPSPPPNMERVVLKRIADKWKIIGDISMFLSPEEREEAEPPLILFPDYKAGSGMITMFAGMIASPEKIAALHEQSQKTQCSGHLSQLAVAAVMLSHDYKYFAVGATSPLIKNPKSAHKTKIFKFLKAPWQMALFDFVQLVEPFACPKHSEKWKQQAQNNPVLLKEASDLGLPQLFPPQAYEAYAFNEHLVNVWPHKITKPKQTVMIYEGKSGKLEFRHDGKANVAFADGHVETIGPDDVKKLIWNPKGKAND
jgi:prepilin-type processing-associated H-X9-DG protein